MNYLLLNFILKRSNSEPPNYRQEQVTVLGKNRKRLNQDVKKIKPGYCLKKIFECNQNLNKGTITGVM